MWCEWTWPAAFAICGTTQHQNVSKCLKGCTIAGTGLTHAPRRPQPGTPSPSIRANASRIRSRMKKSLKTAASCADSRTPSTNSPTVTCGPSIKCVASQDSPCSFSRFGSRPASRNAARSTKSSWPFVLRSSSSAQRRNSARILGSVRSKNDSLAIGPFSR